MEALLQKDCLFTCDLDAAQIVRELGSQDCYFTSGGRLIDDISSFLSENSRNALRFHVHLRLRGGKGGFGSMLRSFRVNRSTNQLMCRDLNGRRVATTEEEKKLRTWLQKAAEREKKKLDKKKAKLEKLRGGPAKHQFNDPDYIRQKEDILEKTEEAFEHGFEHFKKRRAEETNNASSSDSDLDLDEYGQPHAKRKKMTAEERNGLEKCDEEDESSDSENECDPELLKEIQDYFEHKPPVEEEPSCFKNSTEKEEKAVVDEKKESKEPTVYEDIDLAKFETQEKLEALGLEHLKHVLKVRGLKCGGSLQERASRLLCVQNLDPSKYPKNLLATKK